ncbi:MAG: sigma-70 family RNA polymerase sigma factor [Planctomycetes bacterium]|nr:sigma-70 family RNA polymerase sigma factor [Planctomycetota bacterium]
MEQAGLLDTTDLPLVRRCKGRDSQAFNELVLKYQDRIYNAVYRMVGDASLAYDLCQETFLKAYGALDDFEERSAFFTWLYRIAINLCLSHRRSRRRSHEVLVGAPGSSDDDEARPLDPPDPGPGPTAALEESDRDRQIHAAIQSLEAEFRSALVLRDIEGLSYEEIAAALKVPIGTVRSRIHRAREELKVRLKHLVED